MDRRNYGNQGYGRRNYNRFNNNNNNNNRNFGYGRVRNNNNRNRRNNNNNNQGRNQSGLGLRNQRNQRNQRNNNNSNNNNGMRMRRNINKPFVSLGRRRNQNQNQQNQNQQNQRNRNRNRRRNNNNVNIGNNNQVRRQEKRLNRRNPLKKKTEGLLYIRNLSLDTVNDDVKSIFEVYGKLKRCAVFFEKSSGVSTTNGVVQYTNGLSAQRARSDLSGNSGFFNWFFICFLGTLLKGKNIIVEFPAEKRKNTKPVENNENQAQDVEMKM